MRMDPTSSRFFLCLVAAVGFVAQGVQAQSDLCSCSPGTYNFTLNFGAACEDIVPTDGILATSCRIEPLGNDPSVTDLVPVTVSSIVVVELGEDRSIIAQENYYQSLSDGDTIEYSSIILEDQQAIPTGIQLNVIGLNTAGESIVNIIALQYTNNCSVFPVLDDGFSIGWTVLTGLGNPPNGVCTAYDEGLPPSLAPTTSVPSPTAPPSVPPTTQTDSPITSPTGVPTGAPISPTLPPVVSPAPTTEPVVTPAPSLPPVVTSPPTEGPTSPPVVTSPPTEGPTSPPVVTSPPTAAPTGTSMSMSLSMSMEMGDMYDMLEEFGIQVPKAKDGRTAKKTKSAKKGTKSEKAGPKDGELDTKKGNKTVHAKKRTKNDETDVGETTKSSKKGGHDADATATTAKQPKKEGGRRRLRIQPVPV